MNKLFKKAFISSVPVMAGYLVLGAGFGIILKSHGYSILWAFLMSLFIYAGSMQFVAINLLTAGASFLTFAITTLLVNSRHLFYGISMIDKYKKAGAKKPYLIFALTDETYSLVSTGHDDMNHDDYIKYCFILSLINHSYWILGSVLGALIGTMFSFNTEGIDFALTALFLTILVDQWRSVRHHFPALTGLLVTLVCLFIFGPDSFLIPSMIVIATVLLTFKKKEESHD